MMQTDPQPGHPEVCDGIDNNCRAGADENLTREWYADSDRDGYGDLESILEVCKDAEDPAGTSPTTTTATTAMPIKPWAQETRTASTRTATVRLMTTRA